MPWYDAGQYASPAEYLGACMRCIEAHEPTLHAFLTVCEERARDQLARGARVPVAVKDNITKAGVVTTCGSRVLENFTAPTDATAVERLVAAGCAIVGKTNMDEFAMGSSTEHSAYGSTRNPWDSSRVPGGSSGGSAAAVAARLVPIALGSDTGGSVRQPAAFCGIVGLKPTYGRVSRSGLVAFASSLDQIGIMTKTVRECAEVLAIVAGHDPRDVTSSATSVDDYSADLPAGVAGLRFAVVPDAVDRLDAESQQNFNESVAILRRGGASIGEVQLPSMQRAIAAYYVIANAEASANLARFDGVRYGQHGPEAATIEDLYVRTRSNGFGAEVKRRIMLGTFTLSAGYHDAFYERAQHTRAHIREEFASALRRFVVILTPTTPTPAFRLGEKLHDPLAMYLSDVFTVPANLTGIPALAVPAGFSRAGLPLSLQIMGRHFAERTLFRAAAFFERETAFWRRRPPLRDAPAS